MKLTIKPSTGNVQINQLSDGVEITFDEKEKDLWKSTIEMWLEDNNDNLKDYKKFYISNKDKMYGFKGK